jgi:hypothetical protein
MTRRLIRRGFVHVTSVTEPVLVTQRSYGGHVFGAYMFAEAL